MRYVVKWLLPYWRLHKYRMILIVILGIFSAALQSLIPFYIKKIINGFERNLTLNYLILNVSIMLGLGVVHFLVNLFAQRNRAYMNYRIEYEVRNNFFNHILNLDEHLFFKYSVGDLITRLVDDISEKISWFSCSGVFRFIQAFFTLIAIISMMIYLNFNLTLISLIPMPFMVIFVTEMGKKLNKRYDELQKSISNIYDYLETSFSGIKVIKANMKEEKFYSRFINIAQEQMNKSINTEKLHLIIHYAFFATGFLSVFLVYFIGGMMAIDGKITVGDIVSFQIYTFMLIGPFSDVSQFFVSLNRARVSMKRLDDIFNVKKTICITNNKKFDDFKIIKIRDLTFEVDGKKIINNINFDILKGRKIAVVGKIGSSKTIFLKLISRIIQHSDGSFYIDENNVESFELKSYYRKVSYVSQEPQIFSDTILNNITCFDKYSDDEIKLSISISQLEKDIQSMPKGINTYVGNKGVSISGGQKQRIALARALIRKPLILIMDDSTNQMDAETENNFWNMLFEYFKNITIIFVSHRTKTIEIADEIVVMDNGSIVEKGSHKELISRDGLYKQIYTKYKISESK